MADPVHPAVPSRGAKAAPGKWQGPLMEVDGANWRAAFFYGPWQCNRRWMESCKRECAEEGHTLKGCMWLADMKLDWQGQALLVPMPLEAGTRYAIWHCCCDYAELTTARNAEARAQWASARSGLRQEWGRRFGNWPMGSSQAFPGHHIRDLKHGGNPTDLNNILPVPPSIHEVFNEQYPLCYAGGGPWNTVGPDLPYTDK